ncbi:MAG: 6-phosphofructokinase [Akkermansiaceae bacterium]|nr:6-phosphofructokinase [Akkermansiaceae bacterium]
MVGAGFVPGINAVIKGAATAAAKSGWEVVGIRDGFAGLLQPELYPDGGLGREIAGESGEKGHEQGGGGRREEAVGTSA